jgi:hypothetical protein
MQAACSLYLFLFCWGLVASEAILTREHRAELNQRARSHVRQRLESFGVPIAPALKDSPERKREIADIFESSGYSWYGCETFTDAPPFTTAEITASATFFQTEFWDSMSIKCLSEGDLCGEDPKDLYTIPICEGGTVCKPSDTSSTVYAFQYYDFQESCTNCTCYTTGYPGKACENDFQCRQPLTNDGYNLDLICDPDVSRCTWYSNQYDPISSTYVYGPRVYASPGDACVVDENCYDSNTCLRDNDDDETGECQGSASGEPCVTSLGCEWGLYCSATGSCLEWAALGDGCVEDLILMCGVDPESGYANMCSPANQVCYQPFTFAPGDPCYGDEWCMEDSYCQVPVDQNYPGICSDPETIVYPSCNRYPSLTTDRWDSRENCSYFDVCVCVGGDSMCVPRYQWETDKDMQDYRGVYSDCRWTEIDVDQKCFQKEQCLSDPAVPGTCCYDSSNYCGSLQCWSETARLYLEAIGRHDIERDLVKCLFPDQCTSSRLFILLLPFLM